MADVRCLVQWKRKAFKRKSQHSESRMASGELRDELNCTICLNLYTDPVSLRCGHNFCRSCIVQVLDTQDGSGGYSCPDCRAEYPERPALEKNRKLGNIVERFLSTQPDMEETRIFCTYCTKSPVPAVKSCLQCENSLCDDHLTAHNKTMDHILMEPSGSFGNKKCPIHKKVLEYYCPEDSACLCVSCCLVGKHRGHQVGLLEEASEEKKKELRKNLDELNSQKAEIQTKVQNLQKHKRNIKEKTSDKRESVSKLFMDIKKQLRKAEKKALSEISRQEEKIMFQISDLIKILEIEEDELSRKMCHLEEMCHVTDPIRLLEECGHRDGVDTGENGGKRKSHIAGLFSGKAYVHGSDTIVQVNRTDQTEESDLETSSSDYSMETEESSVSDLPGKADDLDEVLISLTLHRSMRDIITNVTSQLGFHVPDILLDVDTADVCVKLSEDLKTATNLQREPNRSKPLGWDQGLPQVLSRCVLSSGRHYWEVKCSEIGRCDVGISYPSNKGRVLESIMGANDISWGLALHENGEFSVLHDWHIEFLDPEAKCSTLGVFLDYEAGRLSFYELCDPIRHLHTFTASFTEPLHAVFRVCAGASLTLRR